MRVQKSWQAEWAGLGGLESSRRHGREEGWFGSHPGTSASWLGEEDQGSYEDTLDFLGKSLSVPQKKKNTPGVTLLPNNSIPRYISQRMENMGSYKSS